MIQSPYPRSETIKGIRWLTENQPFLPSHGDVWSCTWAADGNVYAAADDCQGVNRSNQSNLAVFKVPGPPTAPAIELVNPMHLYGGPGYYDGFASWKADGLTCVDGVLYLGVSQHSWAGHFPDNIQRTYDGSIVKSTDHGVTWSPKPVPGRPMWPWVSFSTPFFVQFGQDYREAIDDFVYAVSNDGTWNNGNYLTLRRCPRKRIGDLNPLDWEIITGLDAAGEPKWDRMNPTHGSLPGAAIFRHRGFTSMTGMQYVPAVKRFVLPQWAYVDLDREYAAAFSQSGLWLYEAPHPWGPWRLFHVEPDWNQANYNPSLPAKWFEEGGRAMWMVSAGDFLNHQNPNHQYRFLARKFELLF